jgi:nucleoside-diphosphate-sugar epimerase
MLALAQMCAEKGVLERFVHVGTSSVSGRRTGPVYEDQLEMGQRYFNAYEQSKAESERLVRDQCAELPCTIFRPSIIVGDSRTGRTTLFNVIYIPLRLLHRGLLTALPAKPEALLDIVPIDWVSDAMVHIIRLKESAGMAFHLTAGPERATTLGDLIRLAGGYFDRRSPIGRPRTVEFVSAGEWNERLEQSQGRERALMAQLATLLPYISIDRLFDSRNTDNLLRESGIRFPLFEEYAGQIFEYCLRSNWGKRN